MGSGARIPTLIVTDTHAWIWWMASDPLLSRRARDAMERADIIGVPAACLWELAWLEANERIRLSEDLLLVVSQVFKDPRLRLLPLTPEIAVRGARLGQSLSDPGDRQIVATAIQVAAPLVTRDGPITRSGLVRTIW